MATYYTSTFMYYDAGIICENHYDYVPSLFFFDTAGEVPFEVAHAAARVAFAAPEVPLLANAWTPPKGTAGQGWFFTTHLRLPAAPWVLGGPERPRYADFRPRVVRPDGSFTELDLADRYEHCGRLEQMMGGCPCELNRQRVGGGCWDRLTECQARNLYLKNDFISRDHLLGRQGSGRFKKLPTHANGFRFIEYRTLRDKVKASSATDERLERVHFSDDHIDDMREKRSETGRAAAVTRNFRRKECAKCVFTCTQRSGACDGAKTEEGVEMYVSNDLRSLTQFQRNKGFTDAQLAFLLRHGGSVFLTKKTWAARARRYAIGFVTKHGSCRLYRDTRNTRDQQEHLDLSSWKELVEYFPAIDEAFKNVPEDRRTAPLWAQRVAAYASISPWRERRRAFRGSYRQDLTRLEYNGYALRATYNHYGYAAFTWYESTPLAKILEDLRSNASAYISPTYGEFIPQQTKDET